MYKLGINAYGIESDNLENVLNSMRKDGYIDNFMTSRSWKFVLSFQEKHQAEEMENRLRRQYNITHADYKVIKA